MKNIVYRIDDYEINKIATLLNMSARFSPIFLNGGSYSINYNRFVFDKLMFWSVRDKGIIVSPFYFDIGIPAQPIFVPKIESFKLDYLNNIRVFGIGDFGIITSVSIYKICFEYKNILLDMERAILFITDEDRYIFLEFSEEAAMPTITLHLSKEKIVNMLTSKEEDYAFRSLGYELSRTIDSSLSKTNI